jgi:translocation and assembly module TamB
MCSKGAYTVDGTVANPQLHGQIELANGQAEVPPLGIVFSPLTVKMTSDAQGAQLLATAHSGSGKLRAESTLPFNHLLTGPYTIRVNGDSFRAAHIPGLDLELSPGLRLIFGDTESTV